MNRMPLALERAVTANTFQAWDTFRVWNQGRIHFTPSEVIYQPSYYVDRMFGDEWLPIVVQAECSEPTLDVLAKKNAQDTALTLYLVNIADTPTVAFISLNGFSPRSAKATRMHADLGMANTPESPKQVTPQSVA